MNGANERIILHRCECGRIKKYGHWEMPTHENGMLEEMARNLNRIVWIEKLCPACRVTHIGYLVNKYGVKE